MTGVTAEIAKRREAEAGARRMTMTADERAEQLVLAYFEDYDGGDAEAELRELAQRAFRAAEQVAEQRGAERALLECAEHVQEWSDQPAFQMLADEIRARAKQQESTDV